MAASHRLVNDAKGGNSGHNGNRTRAKHFKHICWALQTAGMSFQRKRMSALAILSSIIYHAVYATSCSLRSGTSHVGSGIGAGCFGHLPISALKACLRSFGCRDRALALTDRIASCGQASVLYSEIGYCFGFRLRVARLGSRHGSIKCLTTIMT